MTYAGMGGLLMGVYLGERYEDETADDWTVIRSFVDRSSPAQGFEAGREIAEWLSITDDDEALLDLYDEKGGNYAPDPTVWSLRECLQQVSDYVVAYSASVVQAAERELVGLPEELVSSVVVHSGTEGRAWLEQLPAAVDACARRWSLTVGPPYRSSSRYLLRATMADGAPVVLSLDRPGLAAARGARALAAFDGIGMVRLLRADVDMGAVLLEAGEPGRPLSSLVADDDEAATEIVASSLAALWRPGVAEPAATPAASRTFLPLAWQALSFARYRDLRGERGPLPYALVTDAERVLTELLASSPAQGTLLHGDLHHDNIVSSNRSKTGWLAIDPKAYVGDAGYDVAAMFYNPLAWVATVDDLDSVLRRRLAQLSEHLAMDEERLRAWAFVKAILSELWFVEDTGVPNGVPLRVAHTLREMR